MKALGVIPARIGSTRFPEKPLVVFFGKAMIEHTYAAAASSKLLSKVVVTSDNERVLKVIQNIGGDTVLTGTCNTGTDRIVQALHLMDRREIEEYDVVVNIQGDEPGVDPRHIDSCIDALRGAAPDSVMSTLATPIVSEQEARSRDVVKCVADCNSNALYFSRAMIPHSKSGKFCHDVTSYLRHVGMYAFRKDFLLDFPKLPVSNLEASEDLEQLRVLSAGYRIKIVQVKSTLPGVDTRADLEYLMAHWPEDNNKTGIE
ncbi:3-deoxy-d-manno-octulosonate cytidylyltransferase [Plasmopara halstedii]|uniref:3-deoxy-manno-octulosonate cytidylyltransferase n=1 Tax=Plasmopara halstedii TaxID=4781 RepID=A0A0P1ATB5_PLAHL|nr:3-deoxy-d-manno-octulosonate cytidylyltransferase [Plasmopara halstedii]CEG43974.1 3-deoxy-d-manno-octulosonate cytidylyltransferase [Plasmopara halstedii]|eukprot:XP_024580343.1 3-deoxy-d-manno-octulosonate cytidylyltransferase [Plasmopara halstedii]